MKWKAKGIEMMKNCGFHLPMKPFLELKSNLAFLLLLLPVPQCHCSLLSLLIIFQKGTRGEKLGTHTLLLSKANFSWGFFDK